MSTCPYCGSERECDRFYTCKNCGTYAPLGHVITYQTAKCRVGELEREVARLRGDVVRALVLLAQESGWDEGIALLCSLAGLPQLSLPTVAVQVSEIARKAAREGHGGVLEEALQELPKEPGGER